MASKYHSDVSFDNVREGLVTSADAAAIPFNALAEAVNVEISNAGTVRTRDLVFNIVGEDADETGEVLEIHQSSVFDHNGIDAPIGCNKDDLAKRGSKPEALLGADGNPKLAFLVSRALRDDTSGAKTRIDSLRPNLTWEKNIAEMSGHHHHNMVDQLGRTYISNNDTVLRWLAITGDPAVDNYNYNYLVGDPTCNSEFEVGTQAMTIVTAVSSIVPNTFEGSVVIGQGLIDCGEVWDDLIKYIRDNPPWVWDATYLITDGGFDPNNPGGKPNSVVGYIHFNDRSSDSDLPKDDEIRQKAMDEFGSDYPNLEKEKVLYQLTSHTRRDKPGKAKITMFIQAVEGQCISDGDKQSEFELENLTTQDSCDRTFFFKESPHPPPNGLFSHIAIRFNDGTEKWYCPSWCCGANTKLAEGIKGNLLEIDNNRLFISDGTKINYSAVGLYNGWERGNARYLGNFFNKGIYRQGSDAGIVDFPRDGKIISSLVTYENDLYAHRGGNIWKIIMAQGASLEVEGEPVPYFDRVRINSLGSADFIRSALDGDDFQFWVSSRNSTMVAYGLYPTLTAPSSKVVSFKVEGTITNMDLSRGTLLRWGDLVFLSGQKIDERDCVERPSRMFAATGKKAVNNWTLVYSKAFDIWTQIDRGFSLFYAGKDGNAYAGDYNGRVYRMDRNGMFDDGRIREDGSIADDDQTPISTRIKWKSADFGNPNLPKKMMGLWIEGWVGSGSEVEMGTILDQTVKYSVKAEALNMVAGCAASCTSLRGRFNSQYFNVYLQVPADTTFLRSQPFINRDDGYIEIISVTPILPQDSVENDLDLALEVGTAVKICLQETKQ